MPGYERALWKIILFGPDPGYVIANDFPLTIRILSAALPLISEVVLRSTPKRLTLTSQIRFGGCKVHLISFPYDKIETSPCTAVRGDSFIQKIHI